MLLHLFAGLSVCVFARVATLWIIWFHSLTQEVFQSDSHVTHFFLVCLKRDYIWQSASTLLQWVSKSLKEKKSSLATDWPSTAADRGVKMTAWLLGVLVLCLSDGGVTGCSGKKRQFLVKLLHIISLPFFVWSQGWNCSFRDFKTSHNFQSDCEDFDVLSIIPNQTSEREGGETEVKNKPVNGFKDAFYFTSRLIGRKVSLK